MPRFQFQIVHDERPSGPEEALELRDINAAWEEATITAGELLKEIDGSLEAGTDWKIEVKDESGIVLRSITISARGYRQ